MLFTRICIYVYLYIYRGVKSSARQSVKAGANRFFLRNNLTLSFVIVGFEGNGRFGELQVMPLTVIPGLFRLYVGYCFRAILLSRIRVAAQIYAPKQVHSR